MHPKVTLPKNHLITFSPYSWDVGVTILYDFNASTVKRYSDNTVVKKGPKDRRESEAAGLDLAAQLGLPVPRVHKVTESTDSDGKLETDIRMDFIEGQTLASIWPTLSLAEKRDICRQLRVILDAMREAEWPGTTIGGCQGGIAMDCRAYGTKKGGPFHSEEDFNSFILDIWELTPKPMRGTLVKHQRTDHRIVFSHGDLHQDNIMIRNGKIVALIDWEFSGWYPEYWDYVKFCCAGSEHRDWLDFAGDIFSQTYDEQLLFHMALSRFQRG